MSPASTEKTASMTPLRVDVVQWGDESVVALEGRLDETFEQTLVGVFNRLLEKKRVRVVLDLRRLQYLNSRGVSAFIAAADTFRGLGGDVKLSGAPAQARLVLERLGVDRLLQQFDTPEEAMKAFVVPIAEFMSNGGLEVFVVGARSKTFHASGCAKVKRLKSVRLLSSKKAARDAGLRACSRCSD